MVNDKLTGKKLITGEATGVGVWAECYICKHAFYSESKTLAYCNQCEGAFCPMHGTFRGNRGGICVRCFTYPEDAQMYE